jgi:hypothetical protein
MASSLVNGGNNIGEAKEFHRGIKSEGARKCILSVGMKAVWARIRRMKRRVRLKDKVGLSGNPEAIRAAEQKPSVSRPLKVHAV